MSSNTAIALSSRYTQVHLGIQANHYPQLEVISEEPQPVADFKQIYPSAIARRSSLGLDDPGLVRDRRRESIAITPACDCNNCFWYCCCSCKSIYTSQEYEYYRGKFTCWPTTSWAINHCLEGMDEDGNKEDCQTCNRPGRPPCANCLGLLAPVTCAFDIITLIPRCIKSLVTCNK